MDGAQARGRHRAVDTKIRKCGWVGGRGDSCEALAWARVEVSLVQILVVVANIQARSLKGEVGKGSTPTLIEAWVSRS